MDKNLLAARLEQAIEGSLLGLLIILPVAHVTAVRSFLIFFPVVLWIARMAIIHKWDMRTPVDLPVLFFCLAVILSVFWAINPAAALKEMKAELITYMLIFYMTTNIIRREEQLRRFAIVACLWVIVFGLIGMVLFFLDGGQLLTRKIRLASLAHGCTNYSDYIVLVFPLLAWAAYMPKGTYAWVSKVAVVVAIFTLYLTHSRAGWIAVAVEALLLTYIMLRQRLLTGILLASLVGFFYLLPQELVWHGDKTGISLDLVHQNSESGRLWQWVNGVNEALKHPFKGFGYGRDNYIDGMNAMGHTTIDVNACNAFLDAWLQLGAQGMLALLSIFMMLMFIYFKRARKRAGDETYRSLNVCAFVTVVGFFVVNLAESSYLDEMAMTFWLLMGVYMGMRYTQDPVTEARHL